MASENPQPKFDEENDKSALDDFPDDGIASTTSSIDGEFGSQTARDESSDGSQGDWEDLLGSKQLLRKVVKQGTGDAQPVPDDLVTISVEGKLDNDKKVDCCGHLSFSVGQSDVITAFDLCVPFMKVGEINLVRTLPRFAYGSVGKDDEIPPNSTITYTIELLSIEKGVDVFDMTIEQGLDWADKKKQRGNYYFLRGEYEQAIDVYRRGLKLQELNSSGKELGDEKLRLMMEASATLNNNLAAAQLKIEAWDAAIESLRQCLLVQPENVKALFRKAQAYVGKGQYDVAIAVLRSALDVDPNNQLVKKELARVGQLRNSEHKKDSLLYKRMFREFAPSNDKPKSGFVAGLLTFLKENRWIVAALMTAVATPFIYRLVESRISKN